MKKDLYPRQKKTILIVDDDQVAVHIYQEKFQRHGFTVEVADNRHNAMQKVNCRVRT